VGYRLVLVGAGAGAAEEGRHCGGYWRLDVMFERRVEWMRSGSSDEF
jgi:hypothetical protein